MWNIVSGLCTLFYIVHTAYIICTVHFTRSSELYCSLLYLVQSILRVAVLYCKCWLFYSVHLLFKLCSTHTIFTVLNRIQNEASQHLCCLNSPAVLKFAMGWTKFKVIGSPAPPSPYPDQIKSPLPYHRSDQLRYCQSLPIFNRNQEHIFNH